MAQQTNIAEAENHHMFGYDVWTQDINKRVQEVGENAVAKIMLFDGQEYYVRKVRSSNV